MKKVALILIVATLFMSVTSDVQRKYIRSGDYDIVCHVSLKAIKNYTEGIEYYWFKSGEIHNSVSQSGGFLLHDSYEKFYRSKQLAEKGNFDYGLKDDEWRTWYENGNIATITKWRNGQKNGMFLEYDSNGTLVLSGYYSKNEKAKTWINHRLKDTVYFKGDSTYTVKPKSKINGFFSRVFKKRDSTEKAQRKLDRQLKRTNDSIKRAQRQVEKEAAKANKDASTNN
nr:hypothetical protein [uncultured Psychroserpens sp.]